MATTDFLAWPQDSMLIVDDEPGMRSFLQRALSPRSHRVDVADSVEAAEPLLARNRYDRIILDITLPGKSGVVWLAELRERGYTGDVILMTAFADLETAIDALRAGASDFLLKPFRLPQLLNAIQRCAERSRLVRENFVLRREVTGFKGVVEGLVGESPQMIQVCNVVKRIAPMPSTVLVLGESGTGKEVVARALHSMSPRANGPFVPLNCAAIAAELIESELFGHVKGAFTGAQGPREGLFYYAHGGMLFLDEIAELPLPSQARLLRVLEERKIRPVGSEQEIAVDVRIVAATNRNLAEEVAAGRFRQDLFYRLQVVEIRLPPLRERRGDIPALLAHFSPMLARQLGVEPVPMSEQLIAQIAQADYDWPGNIRELRNLVERSLILGEWRRDFLPDDAYVPAHDAVTDPKTSAYQDLAEASDAEMTLEAVERRHILLALQAAGGNRAEAARRLGVSRKTLDRRCAEWGL